MKENTQEKKLVERIQNSIVYKIKNFFRKLFDKKDNAAEEIAEEQTSIQDNKFKENIKISELNEETLLELQQKYRTGKIKETELTDEEIEKLCALYDKQIKQIQKSIEIKENMVEAYKKRNKYKSKKNNA